MHHFIEKSELAKDTRTYELWDGTLHRTIAEAAHNHLLLSIFNAVNATRQDNLWGRLKKSAVTPAKMIEYTRQLLTCIGAIESRSVAKAESTMARHLEVVKKDLLIAAVDVEKRETRMS